MSDVSDAVLENKIMIEKYRDWPFLALIYWAEILFNLITVIWDDCTVIFQGQFLAFSQVYK